MKNKVKSEKGIMTMYVTIAVVTFTIILVALFSLAVATRRNQIKTLIKIKEVYEQDNSKKEQIYMEQKKKIELPSTSDTTPYYPDDTFRRDSSTDLDTGLVIKDKNKNEYVWIEVPKTAEVYPTAGLKITNFTVDEYTAIETDLHTYTNYYRNGTSFTDEYPSDKVLAGTGLDSDAYTALKQKMLKSVYENGGFWIGRYEAGIAENRTSKEIDLATAPAPLSTSKTGTEENPIYPYPYTYVTCSQAQTLASKLSTGKSYTSSLMFGVQWDLVLKHIETKEVEKGTALATIQSALRSNSSSWGNYRDASFTINRGKYAKDGALSTWYNYNTALENCVTYANGTSTKISASDYNNSILLTTGASDACKKMNIYDLAGNVSELTLEYTADSNVPCTVRGGSYHNVGSGPPASYRYNLLTTLSVSTYGFRSSLFK
jgi:hypothetical protein